MPLYEVAILEKPTKKEAEEGAREKLVFGPKAIVAKDAQSAATIAVIGEKFDVNPDQLEILTRPFK